MFKSLKFEIPQPEGQGSHFQKCNTIIHIVHVTCFMCVQYILDLCQHRLSTADYAKTTAV
jgi:hypothetical protein